MIEDNIDTEIIQSLQTKLQEAEKQRDRYREALEKISYDLEHVFVIQWRDKSMCHADTLRKAREIAQQSLKDK